MLREVHGPEGAGGVLAPSNGSAPRSTEAVLAGTLAEVLHVEQVPGDANFFDDLGADSMVMAQFCARVRKRTDLPSVSIKDVYQHPTISSLATALAPPSSNPVEQAFTQLLAEVLHVEQVPGDANFFDDLGADSMVMAQFCARVRKRTDLPSVSIKDVYQHPTISSLATALAPPSNNPVEQAFTQLLAEVLHVEQVPGDANFFDDLGADSMVMAQFCARVRKRTDLPSVSIKDVYQHPTISGPGDGARAFRPGARGDRRADVDRAGPTQTAAQARPARASTCCAAALQFLLFLGYTYLAAIVFELSLRVDLRRR